MTITSGGTGAAEGIQMITGPGGMIINGIGIYPKVGGVGDIGGSAQPFNNANFMNGYFLTGMSSPIGIFTTTLVIPVS